MALLLVCARGERASLSLLPWPPVPVPQTLYEVLRTRFVYLVLRTASRLARDWLPRLQLRTGCDVLRSENWVRGRTNS